MKTITYNIVTEDETKFQNVYNGTNVQWYANRHYVMVYFKGTFNTKTSFTSIQNTSVPTDYCPVTGIYVRLNSPLNYNHMGYVGPSGIAQVASSVATNNVTLRGLVMFPRRRSISSD